MLEFDPLDEYPIHQVPLPMRYVGPSDRNFYDRCIYQGVDHEGDAFFITGLGVYPNLGVIDAYATVRRGDRQWAVRASGSRPDDKLQQAVGPYRIEVIEPYHEIRVVCDADEHGIGFDLRYSSEYGPISEPAHIRRMGDRILLDASRFAGVGTWSGELRVDGETIAVTPERFTATRDRSWGIRPVGEAEPPGRPARVRRHVVELDPAALRRLHAARHPRRGSERTRATRTSRCAAGPRRPGRRRSSSAGRFPRSPTSRAPAGPPHAAMELVGRDGKTHTLEIEPIVGIPLNVGCGYGADPDWTHGVWKGDDWVEGSVYDYADPAVSGRGAFSIVDHIARATFDGQVGWGIFEHGNIGKHEPSGFTDMMQVAP